MENVLDVKKRLKSIVTLLHKSVECPVCLETLRPAFKACVRGHGVCLECTTSLDKCPLCQEPFSLENLICIKSVLEALPHVCCYSDEGCEEIVEPGNDHEMFCGYRPIICRHAECSVKTPVVQFLDHLKSHHSEWCIVKNESTPMTWHIKRGVIIEVPFFEYTAVFLFNNLFWVLYINDLTEKQVKIFFQATPIGKLEHDYYVRIKFEKEKFVYVYTLKAQVLSSCERKFEEEEDEEEDEDDGNEPIESLDDEYCMRIPRKELSKFMDDEGNLKFRYEFFRV